MAHWDAPLPPLLEEWRWSVDVAQVRSRPDLAGDTGYATRCYYCNLHLPRIETHLLLLLRYCRNVYPISCPIRRSILLYRTVKSIANNKAL